jgi:hypothetical protein
VHNVWPCALLASMCQGVVGHRKAFARRVLPSLAKKVNIWTSAEERPMVLAWTALLFVLLDSMSAVAEVCSEASHATPVQMLVVLANMQRNVVVHQAGPALRVLDCVLRSHIPLIA